MISRGMGKKECPLKKRDSNKRRIKKTLKSPRDTGKEKAEELRSTRRGYTYI